MRRRPNRLETTRSGFCQSGSRSAPAGSRSAGPTGIRSSGLASGVSGAPGCLSGCFTEGGRRRRLLRAELEAAAWRRPYPDRPPFPRAAHREPIPVRLAPARLRTAVCRRLCVSRRPRRGRPTRGAAERGIRMPQQASPVQSERQTRMAASHIRIRYPLKAASHT